MAATIDGFSFIYYRSPRTGERMALGSGDLPAYGFRHAASAVARGRQGDLPLLPSGSHEGQRLHRLSPPGRPLFRQESIESMARQNVNPLEVLIKGAHDAGMKVHVGIRPAGWSFFEPYSDYWESSFYQQNPRWQYEDRDATPVTRMSWAIPEVRRHMIDLLREQVAFGADGASLAFNRGTPLVLYESAARELFQAQHQVDPPHGGGNRSTDQTVVVGCRGDILSGAAGGPRRGAAPAPRRTADRPERHGAGQRGREPPIRH